MSTDAATLFLAAREALDIPDDFLRRNLAG
jgi:hypothetical protein